MITRVYALYDNKAGCYGSPFHFPSEGQAIRACQDLVVDMSTVQARHPADFSLFFLGLWDDATARFDQSHGAPAHVCALTALLPPPADDSGLFGVDRARRPGNGEARL